MQSLLFLDIAASLCFMCPFTFMCMACGMCECVRVGVFYIYVGMCSFVTIQPVSISSWYLIVSKHLMVHMTTCK